MNYTQKQIANFWAKVDKQDECWEWMGRKDKHGYGVVSINHKSQYAHRMAWVIAYGAIPDGLLVCHHCDNRKCCNPKHLFLGTHKDNAEDRDRKGRSYRSRGERHYNAKLTDQQVIEIRRRAASEKITHTRLAKEYGVCNKYIANIINNLTRKDCL